jgi:hypothetical protein
MSAAVPVRAAELIDGAVHELHAAQREIKSLMQRVSDPWLVRQLEAIEEHVYRAVSKLGD